MFTHPRLVSKLHEKPVYAIPRLEQYPLLLIKSIRVVCTYSLILFVPINERIFSSGRHVLFSVLSYGQKFVGGRLTTPRRGTRCCSSRRWR